MATYEDLAPLTYFGSAWSEVLVAVGWLGREKPYARGGIDEAFVRALVGHVRQPWQPVVCGGFHVCELCRLNQVPPSLHYEGERLSMGVANAFIPGDGRVYCAPSMILHYIDAHEYRPPEPFRQAVLDCPPPGTMAFKRALLRSGGGRLLPSSRLG